jgi:hypothetical protein
MEKQAIIDELHRVYKTLAAPFLSQQQFKQYGRISISTVTNSFGSWKRALEASEIPFSSGRHMPKQKIPDGDLHKEIIRLTQKLGKEPSDREMNALGKSQREVRLRLELNL